MTGKGDNVCPAVLVPFALTLLGSRFVSVEYHLSLDNGGCPASRLTWLGAGRREEVAEKQRKHVGSSMEGYGKTGMETMLRTMGRRTPLVRRLPPFLGSRLQRS